MTSLPRVAHEHHDRLMQHLDEMPAVGKAILDAPIDELRPKLQELDGWLNGLLLPHMEAAEKTLYPELERMMQNRHSMKPMRREHDEIRRLTGVVGHFVEHPDAPINRGTVLLMRRALLRLYATLKAHLIEEELYVPILEGSLTDDQAAELAHALDHAAVATL